MIPWGAYVIGEDNGCALFCINKYSAPSLPTPLIPPHQHCQRHENELRLETRDIYEQVDTYYANTGDPYTYSSANWFQKWKKRCSLLVHTYHSSKDEKKLQVWVNILFKNAVTMRSTPLGSNEKETNYYMSSPNKENQQWLIALESRTTQINEKLD